MNCLIIINTPHITEKMLLQATNQVKLILEKDYEVTIHDVIEPETAKKYVTWLRKKKKEGKIFLTDTSLYSDPYDIILIIGTRWDFREFRNCGILVRYKLKSYYDEKPEREEEWN